MDKMSEEGFRNLLAENYQWEGIKHLEKNVNRRVIKVARKEKSRLANLMRDLNAPDSNNR